MATVIKLIGKRINLKDRGHLKSYFTIQRIKYHDHRIAHNLVNPLYLKYLEDAYYCMNLITNHRNSL